MSKDKSSTVVGTLEVVGLLENLCINTPADLVRALPNLLVPTFPSSITNVLFSVGQPTETQRDSVWVKQNTGGQVLGLFIYTGGKWVAILSIEQPIWVPTVTADGAMTVTLTNQDCEYNATVNYLKIDGSLEFTLGGTVSPTIFFTLPTGFTAAKFRTCAIHIEDGSGVAGYSFNSSPGVIGVRKYDNSNWTLGTLRTINFSGSIPLL